MKATRPFRRLLQGLAVGLLLLIITVLWITGRKQPEQVVRLHGGEVLTLQEITHGKRHVVLNGERWTKGLIGITPPFLRSESGRPDLRVQRSELFEGERIILTSVNDSALAFWTRFEGSDAFWRQPLRIAVRNESGETYETVRPIQAVHNSATKRFTLWELTAFPRRGKEVTLEVFSDGPDGVERSSPLASFTVPNPDPGPHPRWSADPLPQTNHFGQLTVVLSDLRIDPNRFQRANQNYSGGISPVFHIFENEKPSSDWRCETITFSDATGNIWRTRPLNTFISGPLFRLGLDGVFGRHERPWKIEATLYRAANFAPEDQLNAGQLSLAEVTGTNVLNRVINKNGVEFTLNARAGQRYAQALNTLAIEILIKASTLGPDRTIVLDSVKTDEGKAAHVSMALSRREPDTFTWTLHSSASAQTLDLQFGITPLHSFEFIAEPRQMQLPSAE